jgi:hypothetical protein
MNEKKTAYREGNVPIEDEDLKKMLMMFEGYLQEVEKKISIRKNNILERHVDIKTLRGIQQFE